MLRTEVTAGESVDLTLYWQANEPVSQSYTVFTHILNTEGELQAQQDNPPVSGSYPTNWWMPDEIITDSYTIFIPEDAPEQTDASLIVGLYSANSGERLSVAESCAVSSPDNFITLSEINISDGD